MLGQMAGIALVAFVSIVAPIWIVAHYATRWRSTRAFSAEDEARLARLQALAERLERRLEAIERILDAERPEAAGHPEPGDRA
jgi:phage shock protein B